MFSKAAIILCLFIIVPSICSQPLSTSEPGDDYVLIKSDDLLTILRSKREVPLEIDAIQANEPVDKDYDMELAEVNVFRPVFRIRSSYLRRGG